jgi:hypothetical protein
MIAGYFRQTLNMPSKRKWGGHAGTISQICRVFNLPEGVNERVKWVLEYSVSYEARGQVYKGERLKGKGSKPIISSPYEYQIVIDVVEKGKGAAMALLLLNEYRSEERRDPVGLSAVRNTVKRLRPVIRIVRKRKQGNKDKNSPCAKARLGWVTQILVRMKKHVFMPEEDYNKFVELTATPEYFDAAKLPKLSLFQIAFWDEVHKEQVVGTAGTHTYAFPRDEHGAFDEAGMAAAQASKLHMKYTEQGRFCCGVASV